MSRSAVINYGIVTFYNENGSYGVINYFANGAKACLL